MPSLTVSTTGSGTTRFTDAVVEADNVIDFATRFKYQTAFYQLVLLASLAAVVGSNQFVTDPDVLAGRSVDVLLPERFRKQHAKFRNSFALAPESRPMGVGRDLFALRKDGTEFPVEIALNPIKTAGKTSSSDPVKPAKPLSSTSVAFPDSFAAAAPGEPAAPSPRKN